MQGVNEEIQLRTGNAVVVTTDDAYQEAIDEDTIWVDYKNIVVVLEVGKRIYIDDGLISLLVDEVGMYIGLHIFKIQDLLCFIIWIFLFLDCRDQEVVFYAIHMWHSILRNWIGYFSTTDFY